jgi:hypothetical protein
MELDDIVFLFHSKGGMGIGKNSILVMLVGNAYR